jgi:hypothetical protein
MLSVLKVSFESQEGMGVFPRGAGVGRGGKGRVEERWKGMNGGRWCTVGRTRTGEQQQGRVRAR